MEHTVMVNGLPCGPGWGYCMICNGAYPLGHMDHGGCIERARQALALLPEVLAEVVDDIETLEFMRDSGEDITIFIPKLTRLIALSERLRALIGGE